MTSQDARVHLRKHGWSHRRAAEELGVHRRTIQRVLRGEKMSAPLLHAIAMLGHSAAARLKRSGPVRAAEARDRAAAAGLARSRGAWIWSGRGGLMMEIMDRLENTEEMR